MTDVSKIEIEKKMIELGKERHKLPSDWFITDNDFYQLRKHLNCFEAFLCFDGTERDFEEIDTIDDLCFYIPIDFITKKPIFEGYIVQGKWFYSKEYDAVEHLRVHYSLPKQEQLDWNYFKDNPNSDVTNGNIQFSDFI